MKRKILTVLLSATLVCTTAAVLFACGETPEEEYSVTYAKSANLGETGDLPVDSAKYKKDETVTVKASELVLDGYTFAGWSNGSDVYSAGDTFKMPAKNVTLTATWEEDVVYYDVTYVLADGDWASKDVTPASRVEELTVITLPAADAVVREGYNLVGWTINEQDYEFGDTYTVVGNTTIEAVWEALTYTVTFDLDEGSWQDTDASNTVDAKFGTKLSLPSAEDVENGDADFFAWTDGIYVFQGGADYTVSKNVTLKALWTEYTQVKTGEYSSNTYENDQTANDAEYGYEGFTYSFDVTAGQVYTIQIEFVSSNAQGQYQYPPYVEVYESVEAYDAWEEPIYDGESGSIIVTAPEGATTYSIYVVWANWDDALSSTYSITVFEGGHVTHQVEFNDGLSYFPATYTVLHGVTLDKLPGAPVGGTGVFAGWYIASTEGWNTIYHPFDIDTPITSDLTVEARYTSVTVNNGLYNTQEDDTISESVILTDLGEQNDDGFYTITLPEYSDLFNNTDPDAFFYGWRVTIDRVNYTYFPGEKLDIEAAASVSVYAVWQNYSIEEKVETTVAPAKFLNWWTDGTYSAPVFDGKETVLETVISSANALAHTGVLVDVHMTIDGHDGYYRLNTQNGPFTTVTLGKDESDNDIPYLGWAQVTTNLNDGCANYIALFADGATPTQVITARLSNNVLTVKIATYAASDTERENGIEVVYTLTSSVNVSNLTLFYYEDGGAVVSSAKISYAYIIAYSENQNPSAENPVSLGAMDNSTSWTGDSPLWTSLVNKGEKVVISGTQTSAGAHEWQQVLGCLYAKDAAAPVGGWCMNHVNGNPAGTLGLTMVRTESMVGEAKNPPAESTLNDYQKLMLEVEVDCNFVVTVDFTGENLVYEMVLTTNEEMPRSLTATYTFSGDLASAYNFGFGVDGCHLDITSVVRTAHVAG